MRQALFVVNPTGVRHAGVLRRHCEDAARAHGWQPELVVTQGGDASAMLHDQLRGYLEGDGEKLVFAVGGDGTVRACAHDIAGTQARLAVVPRGTANLFAGALHLPVAVDRALEVGFGPFERALDLPFAGDLPFVAMAGMGLDALVVGATPEFLKSGLGWLGYAVTALPHILAPPREVSVRLDGGEVIERRAHSVVVGNVGMLPGGFELLPGAALDDGLLEVGILSPAGVPGWARLARRVVTGHEPRGRQRPELEHFRAALVEVVTPSAAPLQLDGDYLGSTTVLSVELHPGAMLVKVPGP